VLANVEVSESVIAEVQLMPASIYNVKMKTDVLYAIIRELRASYDLEEDQDDSVLRLKRARQKLATATTSYDSSESNSTSHSAAWSPRPVLSIL